MTSYEADLRDTLDQIAEVVGITQRQGPEKLIARIKELAAQSSPTNTGANMKPFKEMTKAELEATLKALNDEVEARSQGEEEARRDASRRISEKLRLVDQLYKECEQAAREAGISFSYTNPDGSGGYFDPNDTSYSNSGWSNSSMNC